MDAQPKSTLSEIEVLEGLINALNTQIISMEETILAQRKENEQLYALLTVYAQDLSNLFKSNRELNAGGDPPLGLHDLGAFCRDTDQ